jgi:hypothetical protein
MGLFTLHCAYPCALLLQLLHVRVGLSTPSCVVLQDGSYLICVETNLTFKHEASAAK